METDPSTPPATARQRWRLVLARDRPDAPIRTEAWERIVQDCGLPLFCPPGRDRPRVAFAAPLGERMTGEQELADIVLSALEPAWRVRERIAACLPDGWRLIDAYDVWLGSPALAGRVVAADYRIEVVAAEPAVVVQADMVTKAATTLLAAERVPRERARGTSTVRYDLRPLLADVRVVDPGPPVVIRARTRVHPELGSGRPDEVVAAIGDAAGMALVTGTVTRERVILADDP